MVTNLNFVLSAAYYLFLYFALSMLPKSRFPFFLSFFPLALIK